MEQQQAGTPATISVFLADDNLIVREGVRALIERHPDLAVVGVAADYDETVSGATSTGTATASPRPSRDHGALWPRRWLAQAPA
ncbi:MAG TPA: hypothetical protein VG123_30260 [Streptosporangiaceae bacterium]|jgi:hypothetical protein|nr:hypothetical protein [Streptosporangiaceae bacterium]